MLDDEVQSAPIIQSEIAGGHAQITLGSSSPDQQREEARSLALLFQSGALAAPLVLTSENFFPR